MSPSAIVQKLWNYCNVLRDDGMSYGDYPSTTRRTGVEQLTYLLFLKMADRRAAWSVSFQFHGCFSVQKWAIMRAREVNHG
jgi:hypothetical protein